MKTLINITAAATILVLGGTIIACDLALGNDVDNKPVPTLGKAFKQTQPVLAEANTAAIATTSKKDHLTVTTVGWSYYGSENGVTTFYQWEASAHETGPTAFATTKYRRCKNDYCLILEATMPLGDLAIKHLPKEAVKPIFCVAFSKIQMFPDNAQEFASFSLGSVWKSDQSTDEFGFISNKNLTPVS